MKYRSEIDGLRAFAVLPVILFHAGFGLFGGGYVGVDVFFVISGFLITGILADDLDRGTYSILDFYERRARRILPALFFVIAVSIPAALAVMMPRQALDFAQSIIATVTFTSNILFWVEADYFAPTAELKPLLHTWSLAVEEQYYIVFPLLLALLWRIGRGATVWVIGAVAVASLIACQWAVTRHPEAAFYLLPFRAWELFVGSLCAFYMRAGPRTGHDAPALAGLALILGSIFVFDDHTPFPSVYALAPVLGTALILVFAQSGTLTARVLSFRPFVWVGLISYSAYLWHQPLFAFARIPMISAPSPALMLGLSAASLGLAYLSWRFVEGPFRNRSAPVLGRRGVLFSVVGVAALALLAVGGYGQVSRGYKALLGQLHPAYLTSGATVERAIASHANTSDPAPDAPCIRGFKRLNDAARTMAQDCAEAHGPGLMVLGDSHSIDLFRLLARRQDVPFILGINSAGCRPAAAGNSCSYQDVVDLVAGNPDLIRVVIFEQAGFYLLRDMAGDPGSREMFQRVSVHDTVPDFPFYAGAIDAMIGYLAELNAQVPVVVFGPRIEPHLPPETIMRGECGQPIPIRDGLIGVFERLDTELARRATAAGLDYVSQNNMIGFDFSRDFGDCDRLFWSDGDHFSDEGEAYFGDRVTLIPEALALTADAWSRRSDRR